MTAAPSIPDLAACTADELRKLVIELLERNAKLDTGGEIGWLLGSGCLLKCSKA
jgi:hypothetical protein